MKKQDCFLFGSIFKAHGYKGYVNLYNETNITINTSEIKIAYLEEDNTLIPFFIEDIRLKKPKILIVKFEDVNKQNEVEKILRKNVYFDKKLIPNNQIETNQKIIGFVTIDKNLGKIGVVKEIDKTTKQKLIKVKNKTQEFFIPFHKNFIKKINLKQQVIEVDIPRDLLSLN